MPKSVFSDAYATFLKVLVVSRREAGLTQIELAARLGKPQSFVSKIERGERRVDVVELCAIAHALRLNPKDLFTRVIDDLPSVLRL